MLNAFTVFAKDNDGGFSNTTIQTQVIVTNVNDAPVLATPLDNIFIDTVLDDIFKVDGKLTGSDIDGDILIYGIVGGVDKGDGTVVIADQFGILILNKSTGAYHFVGKDAVIEALTDFASSTFTVTVSDGLLSDQKTLTINIL
jgi:fibronectin-binding autotransporter adhesin